MINLWKKILNQLNINSVQASIVESLQQQIRMKMILNLAGGGGSINGGGNGNPVLQALAEFQGNLLHILKRLQG